MLRDQKSAEIRRDQRRLTYLFLAVAESPQVFVTVTILMILLCRHHLALTDLSQALRTEAKQVS